jgi:hypothetical protein
MAVHVLMARTLPAAASRVVGRAADLRRPHGRSAVILEDDGAVVSADDESSRARV